MNKKIIFLIVFSFVAFRSSSQSYILTEKENDYEPISLFYQIGDSIRKTGKVPKVLLGKYFTLPSVELFKHDPSFDSTVFVEKMKTAFASNAHLGNTILDQYVENEQLIKNAMIKMEKENLRDSIANLLFPFLPSKFRQKERIPKQIYLILEEGSPGLPGYVFNSMLQTAKVEFYKSGIISAHESYHDIMGTDFNEKYMNSSALSEKEKNLLFFLNLITEEGIADLIDKHTLRQKTSPLFKEVSLLEKNDSLYAINKLKAIDSLIFKVLTSASVENVNYQDYVINGGHIPGRYMGQIIQRANMLSEYIAISSNPVSFFDIFNKAYFKLFKVNLLSPNTIILLKDKYKN